MRQAEQRQEHPDRRGPARPPAPWRLLVVALLATQALGSHGDPADSGVDVKVTNYRICVMHGCNRAEVHRPGRGPARRAAPGAER